MSQRLWTNLQSSHSPSGAAGANSSWPKWLKITGIGCAVLLLVGALLAALGVFQVVSCCTDTHEAGLKAQTEGFEFVTALHEGDFEGAYALLGDEARSEASQTEFEAEFEPYRQLMEANRPLPVRYEPYVGEGRQDEVQIGELGQLQRRWHVVSGFAEPGADRALEIRLIVDFGADGIDDTPGNVASWEVTPVQWDAAETIYGQTAIQFHERLERKNFEDARRMLAPPSDLHELSRDAFVEQLRPTFEQFDGMRNVRVTGLWGIDDPGAVRAEVQMVDGDDVRWAVDYVVDWRGWVYEVGEVRRVGAAEDRDDARDDEPEEAPDDDGENGPDDIEELESESIDEQQELPDDD